jgi:hypothetical protein
MVAVSFHEPYWDAWLEAASDASPLRMREASRVDLIFG